MRVVCFCDCVFVRFIFVCSVCFVCAVWFGLVWFCFVLFLFVLFYFFFAVSVLGICIFAFGNFVLYGLRFVCVICAVYCCGCLFVVWFAFVCAVYFVCAVLFFFVLFCVFL